VRRCGLRLLAEDLQDNNRVGRNVVDDAPRRLAILNSEFVAIRADGRQWPGVRQAEYLALLNAAKQPRFQARGLTEGRRFHLSLQPDERFVTLLRQAASCPI